MKTALDIRIGVNNPNLKLNGRITPSTRRKENKTARFNKRICSLTSICNPGFRPASNKNRNGFKNGRSRLKIEVIEKLATDIKFKLQKTKELLDNLKIEGWVLTTSIFKPTLIGPFYWVCTMHQNFCLKKGSDIFTIPGSCRYLSMFGNFQKKNGPARGHIQLFISPFCFLLIAPLS